MVAILFIVSVFALFCFFSPKFGGGLGGITAFICASIITLFGANRGCSDGWDSPSIGTQGACSYHGGVDEYLNGFGWTMLLLFVVAIALGASTIKDDS